MQNKIRVTPKKKKIMPAGPKTTSFPIVGIGASAGGLEAYQELLKNLSAKPGMAFVFRASNIMDNLPNGSSRF